MGANQSQQQQHRHQSTKVPGSEEGQEDVIMLLEERLEKHDENRKTTQEKFKELQSKLTEQIDELEDRINKELEEKFIFEDDRLQAALNELRENSSSGALQEAKTKLFVIQLYEIVENKKINNDITALYKLKAEKYNFPEEDFVGLASSETNSSAHGLSNVTEIGEIPCNPKFSEEREPLIEMLKERLQAHDNNKKDVQDKLHEICEGLRAQIDELGIRISKELEEKFTSEDNRLQATLNELRGNRTANALQKVKAGLLVEQSYEIIENNFDSKHDLTTLYELKAEKHFVPELLENRKPANVRVSGVNRGSVSIEFIFLNPDEERVLSDHAIVNLVEYKCLLFKKGNEQESKEYSLHKNEGNDSFSFTPDFLEAETTYRIRVKMMFGNRASEWSDTTEFTTLKFKDCCVWKTCSDDVHEYNKYNVDEENPRIAARLYDHDSYYCTIIGNTYIPLNKVIQWNIKILKSRDNDGHYIWIGITQNDINQNDNNYNNGWYFDCYASRLRSGPPHNYSNKEYGPRKRPGEYVHTGDSVGVVVDTIKGELSFILNGMNLGVAYEGIPLDKPLVPCVILNYCEGDSVELDTSEVKENEADSTIPVPSNITAEGTTWDSITLTWDKVNGASFYQIEVDRRKSWGASPSNSFTKRGLFPETKHNFRVRTVKGSSASEWSGVVKGRTLKALEFSGCVWKTCPGDVDDDRKYSVDGENPRVATKINSSNSYCTIIGNTRIPLRKVTSWNIKILKSKNNNGQYIFIGIAPFDVNQNDDNYYIGWHIYCYRSALCSGPPHNYHHKEYGPRKERDEQYVHTVDSVGVVVDTTKRELSFVLNGVNRGVAYEGIPLDKPLVPCVLLLKQGDSVELII